MTNLFGRALLVTLLFSVAEAGFDVGNAAAPAEHSGSHEIHSHPGAEPDSLETSDTDIPAGDDGPMEHYCHCTTHAAALNFAYAGPAPVKRSLGSCFANQTYFSVTFPPPVPPPNA
jgi:hypothetical protein